MRRMVRTRRYRVQAEKCNGDSIDALLCSRVVEAPLVDTDHRNTLDATKLDEREPDLGDSSIGVGLISFRVLIPSSAMA